MNGQQIPNSVNCTRYTDKCSVQLELQKREELFESRYIKSPALNIFKNVILILKVSVDARSGNVYAFVRNKCNNSNVSLIIRTCIPDPINENHLVNAIKYNCKFVNWTEIAVWSLDEVYQRKNDDSVVIEFTFEITSFEGESEVVCKMPPIENLIQLMNDLSNVYSQSINTDCVLKASDGTVFPSHRAVLSARSPVFAAMFHHNLLEKQSGEVVIPDIDGATLNHMLYYMYTGIIPNLTPEGEIHMYNASEKYGLLSLQDKCFNNITSDLKVENICFAIILAQRHEILELEQEIINFLADRCVEVLENDKWKEFAMEHPLITNKYVSAALVARIQSKVQKAVVQLTRCAQEEK